jgi:hypothetical protein
MGERNWHRAANLREALIVSRFSPEPGQSFEPARLVHSGTRVADAPKPAYGLLLPIRGRQAVTLACIDVFIALTIAASIMFLLSFIVRRNDPKAGGAVAVG